MYSVKPSLLIATLLLNGFLAASLRADTELLKNGNFSEGTGSWTLDRIHDAQGSVKAESIDGGKMAAHVVVSEVAAEAFHVQLFQSKLEIKAGETYHLRFRGRSQPGAKTGVNLMFAEAPWTNLWTKEITLTPEWQDFSFDVTPTQSAPNARVTFSRLGGQAGDYWFTEVSLTTANK